MPCGNLQVTAITVRGLSETCVSDVKPFIGCYVQPTEKKRTRAVQGQEPLWDETLKCQVPEGQSTLTVELVNEDSRLAGAIGRGQVNLQNVFSSGSHEQWVEMVSEEGKSIGQVQVKLEFSETRTEYSEHSEYSQQSYSEETSRTEQRTESSISQSSEQKTFGSNDTGAAPPIQTHEQILIEGEDGSSLTQEKKHRDWVKFGGAALIGATAIGLGSWGAYEAKEHYDEKKEQERKHSEDARPVENKPFKTPEGFLQSETDSLAVSQQAAEKYEKVINEQEDQQIQQQVQKQSLHTGQIQNTEQHQSSEQSQQSEQTQNATTNWQTDSIENTGKQHADSAAQTRNQQLDEKVHFERKEKEKCKDEKKKEEKCKDDKKKAEKEKCKEDKKKEDKHHAEKKKEDKHHTEKKKEDKCKDEKKKEDKHHAEKKKEDKSKDDKKEDKHHTEKKKTEKCKEDKHHTKTKDSAWH
ncbi:hypothetical protein CLU79DRAFT_776518 [Phycomyces nitens]|nr:hypothetical protein CLU79DRAFT_776518 [Phycomyces nitens]